MPDCSNSLAYSDTEPSRFGALRELEARGESRNSRGGGGSLVEATASNLKAFRPEFELLGFEDGTWQSGVGGGC